MELKVLGLDMKMKIFLLAFTRVLLGRTLSRLTVYGFSVPTSLSSGDVGILVKSVTSLSCGRSIVL